MDQTETAVSEARSLFNQGRFWQVHEALETPWRGLPKNDEKRLLQGLILAAASLVHLEKKHDAVAWRMMQDALDRLENQPPLYHGWDIAAFRDHLRASVASRQWTPIRV